VPGKLTIAPEWGLVRFVKSWNGEFMSPVNPQICTLKDAQAAAKHLEDAGLHVVSTFIPVGSPFGLPGDKYNKFYLFEMFNGAVVNAALVTTEIRYNPSRWRTMLREDITRPMAVATNLRRSMGLLGAIRPSVRIA
jgi:hypothetical protein